MATHGWFDDTAAAVAAAITGAAGGRLMWVFYKHYGKAGKIVLALMFAEAFVAVVMGLIAYGAIEGAERILMAVLHEPLDLSGWPAFSFAGACGWLGPRGMVALFARKVNGRGGPGPGEGT